MQPNPHEHRSTMSIIERIAQTPTDNTLWEAFYKRYAPLVHRWASRVLPPQHQQYAEDVQQSFFSNMMAKGFGELTRDPDQSPRAFLKKCVRNLSIDVMRKLKREGKSLETEMINSIEANVDSLWFEMKNELDREEIENGFQKVLASGQCTEEEITLYRQRRLEDRSVEDICNDTGKSMATVYRGIEKVEAALRRVLDSLN